MYAKISLVEGCEPYSLGYSSFCDNLLGDIKGRSNSERGNQTYICTLQITLLNLPRSLSLARAEIYHMLGILIRS